MPAPTIPPAATPSPALFFDTMQAYVRSAVLKGALDLDLFSAFGDGAATVGYLAGRCAASERGMRILCDYLVVVGFLTKEGDRYALTPDSAMFLQRRSPAYIGSACEFLDPAGRHLHLHLRRAGTHAAPGGLRARRTPPVAAPLHLPGDLPQGPRGSASGSMMRARGRPAVYNADESTVGADDARAWTSYGRTRSCTSTSKWSWEGSSIALPPTAWRAAWIDVRTKRFRSSFDAHTSIMRKFSPAGPTARRISPCGALVDRGHHAPIHIHRDTGEFLRDRVRHDRPPCPTMERVTSDSL